MDADPSRRSVPHLLAYALANAGGVVAFLPLLTLLLPIKVEAAAGVSRLGLLTICALCGAVAASLGNIAFGWLSDRSVARGRTRRGWAIGGFVLTCAGFAAIHAATTPPAIVAAVMLWQLALNALLSPLFAMMADEVPGSQMGVAGGLLTLANPLGSLVSSLLAATTLLGEAGRYTLICAIVAVAILPVLLVRGEVLHGAPGQPPLLDRRDFVLAWVARLMVQVAGNVLFLYLLFYFATIVPDQPTAALAPRVGQVMALAFALPLPIAIVAGRASDRIGARKPFLIAAAAVAAFGLATMAAAGGWTVAVLGFGIYATGSAVFLALHSGYVMTMIGRADRHGQSLGMVNLANTLPALIGPALTWALATTSDFTAILLALAALTIAGGLLTIPIRSRA